MSSTPADLELDCRGMLCPQPVIELARHLGDVPVGGVVAVIATDVAARYDVPAWCRMRGQEHLGSEPAGADTDDADDADDADDGTRAERHLVRRLS